MASRLDQPDGGHQIVSDLIRTAALVWRTHRGYTFLVASLTFIQGVLPAAQLWIAKLLIDQLVQAIQNGSHHAPDNLGYLLALAAGQAGLLLLAALLNTIQNTARTFLGELLSNQVSLQIVEKTNELEIAFFENEQFHNKLQNAFQEASNRPVEVVFQLFSLMQMGITSASVIFLLLRLHWAILPVILLFTLPALFVQVRYGQQNYWMLRGRTPELRQQQYLGTLLTSDWFIKEIRIFQLENHFTKTYRALFKKFFGENQRLVIRRDVYTVLAATSSALGWFLAVGYAVMRVASYAISIGDFSLYIQAISMAQGQIQSTLNGLSMLFSNILFVRNLFEFLALPSRDLGTGLQWNEPIREVEFRDVSFVYPGTSRPVLHDINFKVRRGQSLALVGKNGVGKTTLVKLLCRLYEPTSGEILINGKCIAEYSPRSVQEHIAVLFQDYGQYQLTARENIGVGRVARLNDMTAIEAAAQKSSAAEFLQNLPAEYETTLGRWFEDGVQLSVGQWQKIALARAFFRQGQILILDEPTASLDAEAEFEIFRKLLQDSSDQISLLISHRFSTVRTADHILVLEAGKCIESGSHEDLMQVRGHYAHLFKLQAQGYEPITLPVHNETIPV